MKPNKQILFATIATFTLAAATLFTGCEKKVEPTDFIVDPVAVMISLNSNAVLNAYFYPSDAKECSVKWNSDNPSIASVKQFNHSSGKVLVTTHSLGETTITYKAKNIEYPTYAYTTVIVNPIEDMNDYATLLPRFYFGYFNDQYTICGMQKYITVKYHSKNKIVFPIREWISFANEEEWIGCSINVDYIADIVKINDNTFGSAGEIYVTINDKYYPASIETTFANNSLEIIIKVKNFPGLEDLPFHFKGNGSFKVNAAFPPYYL